MPRVSILIPVHNAGEWLSPCISSALSQTERSIEVIVLDDGSTDGSIDVARSFGHRIRIEQQANRGQNVSRNRLTSLSSGEWLVYLDADDELAADAVERKLANSARADAVYGTMNLQQYRGGELVATKLYAAADYPDPFAAAFNWKYPNTSSFMMRRSAVAGAGGWNESIRSCTDYDLYFRMLLSGSRLAAAPASHSTYRYWSPYQASIENTERQTTTRLQVMWQAARVLDQREAWTDASKEAFANAALGVIRTLHTVDADAAVREFARLQQWNPHFKPAASVFSSSYRTALRLFGFRGAEFWADAARRLKPRQLPVAHH